MSKLGCDLVVYPVVSATPSPNLTILLFNCGLVSQRPRRRVDRKRRIACPILTLSIVGDFSILSATYYDATAIAGRPPTHQPMLMALVERKHALVSADMVCPQ